MNSLEDTAMSDNPPFSGIHLKGVFGLFDDDVVIDLRRMIIDVLAQA